MSRLDQLHSLRSRIDDEIRREEEFLQRIRFLTTGAKAVATSRADYTTQVLTTTAQHFDVDEAAIVGRFRHRSAVEARQIACWLLRESGRSLPEIGKTLHRDHSTVMYGLKRVEGDERLMAHALTVRAALTGTDELEQARGRGAA